MDAWVGRRANGWLTGSGMARPDAHQVFEPLDFARRDTNTTLPFRPALEIVDAHQLPANDQQSVVRAAQPVVQGRGTDRQAPRRLSGC